METPVPIVVLHIGIQPYFTSCVLLNARYNNVIVIGDNNNKQIADISNVEHCNIQSLNSKELVSPVPQIDGLDVGVRPEVLFSKSTLHIPV